MNKKRGFTLVELLVTLTIIGLLATLSFASVKFAKKKAMKTKALSDTAEIAKAIRMLGNDTDLWSGAQAINAIGTAANNEICGADINGENCGNQNITASSTGIITGSTVFEGWNGEYMKSIPLDPWGMEYFFDSDYRINGNNEPCGCGGVCSDAVVVGSYGPDKIGKPVTSVVGAYGCDDIITIMYK